MIRKVKKEIRIVGIDDAPFDKFKDKKCLVVATIFRGGSWLDGLLSCFVIVDGNDSTEKIIKMISRTKHRDQLQCIMLNGIALGGFNVINIKKLNKNLKLPVIVIIRKVPNMLKIERALKKIKSTEKLKIMKKAGKVKKVRVGEKYIYVQSAGIDFEKVKEIIKITSVHSLVPEPIRIAHLIASGIILGESRGRA